MAGTHTVETVIIGAGFSGIGAAYELLRHGRSDFVVLEKGSDVGGTWRDNAYPGVECDVPSHLYSYSFAPNPHWSKTYGAGAEIHAYQREVVERFALAPHLRLDTRVVRAVWAGRDWRVETEHGDTYTARHVISALGGLHLPNVPTLPGVEDFRGRVFHSARWPEGFDIAGLRVAVIGTGATAVQLAPTAARTAEHLTVFQRSPIWVAPKFDIPYSDDQREAFAADPDAVRRHRWELWQQTEGMGADLIRPGTAVNRMVEAIALQNILDNVDDPETAARLTPDYTLMCKRATFSAEWYPMFNRENVSLVTDPIDRVTADGIVAGGREIPLDVIVYATGFRPFEITAEIDIVGLDGRSLAEAWSERITSYRSVMVDGFPNLYFVLGPNSAGLISALQMIEAAALFAARTIERVETSGVAGLHPSRAAVEGFTAWVDDLTDRSAMGKGCSSWWTRTGVNHSMWPESSVSYRRMLLETPASDFEVVA